MPPENYHLTVKFLGAIDDVEAAGDAVARAAENAHAFTLELGDLGAFPTSRRARVVWIGFDEPSGGYTALADACDRSFPGIEPEHRARVPHLTLARLREPGRVELPPVEHARPSSTVDALVLFRSHLGGPSARYEIVMRHPLRGRR